MALPKKRTSRARRDKRRTHDTLKSPARSECPQCHQPKAPHQACPHCGTYRGRTVMETDED